MESSLTAATAQLENRQWCFGLWLRASLWGTRRGRWWKPQQESGGGSQTDWYTADRLRAQFCWRSRKLETQSYCKRSKLRQKQRQRGPGRD